MPHLQEYLSIKDAAAFLGVTPNTLRSWDMAGRITECRHPVNNYRLYKPEELQRLLADVERSGGRESTIPSHRT
jgi:DNA (cytosine-5)-methyltransferase 1